MTSAIFALSYVKSLAGRVFSEERAQDAFEYLLVIGGVSVLIIVAIASPIGVTLISAVVDGVCLAIDGVLNVATCAAP